MRNEFISSGSLQAFHLWSFSLPVDNNQCYRFEIRDTTRLGHLDWIDSDYLVKIDGEPVEWNADSSETSESITFPAENCEKTSACNITTYKLEVDMNRDLTGTIEIIIRDYDGALVDPYFYSSGNPKTFEAYEIVV